MSELSPSALRRVAGVWAHLSPAKRRRIVLASLLAVSLAARDLVLFLFSATFLALTELAPRAPHALPGRA